MKNLHLLLKQINNDQYRLVRCDKIRLMNFSSDVRVHQVLSEFCKVEYQRSE